jgi:hypothetical protein
MDTIFQEQLVSIVMLLVLPVHQLLFVKAVAMDSINPVHIHVLNAHILVKHAYHQDTVILVYQKSKEDTEHQLVNVWLNILIPVQVVLSVLLHALPV